ncbi:hypothetical protein E2C01_077492 [Portunus trituberculatus]|uniref:Uncharacterized protein n=1 Tax=Portunus trituberculatus TaxID=210409 RepID=A0A5B7IPV4_PORTR|nr:hypothetical protein [Portunus trituberculatus]
MMKVTRKHKGHKKKKKRLSGRKSPALSVVHLISALFFGIPSPGALETEVGASQSQRSYCIQSFTRQIQTQKIR